MSLVSANEVKQVHEHKRQLRKEIYKKILEQFSKKIKHHAQLGQKTATLMVPIVVLGFPTFDRPAAAVYLERQLRNGGYTTRVLDPVTVMVTWEGRPAKKDQTAPEEIEGPFSNLVNLRKVANKYRK